MGFLDFIKIFILGIVEGFTEWLPISSTGHLMIFNSFLKMDVSNDFWNVFIVVVHLGAVLSVVVLFFKKLWPFNKDTENYCLRVPVVALWIKILIASLPAILVGFIFEDFISNNLYTPTTAPYIVGAMLIIYGIVFLYIEFRKKDVPVKYNTISKIPLKVIAYIGLFQLLALIPGTSRPGTVIIGALVLGCSRRAAIEFSIYLGVPVISGASLLKIIKYINAHDAFTGNEIVIMLSGGLVAFIVSIFVIRSILAYVQNHDLKIFGYYRMIVGLIVILFFANL